MKRTIVVILVILLLTGLGLIAQPWPSAQLEVPPSDIIFPHGLHVVDMEIGCDGCHLDIESSTASSDRNFPTMDECAGCHDVESFDNCGMCHRNEDEPGASPHPDRPIAFNHAVHAELEVDCAHCHGDVAESWESSPDHMPDKPLCMACHDGRQASNDCGLCHEQRISLADIHPDDWRHQHGDFVNARAGWCANCHEQDAFCIDCHLGDNLTGHIHDLNYIFTHALDAGSKEHDCTACHNRQAFCNDCHNSAARMPLNHSRLDWLPRHGEAARQDIENCAACHDNADPTCARAGCHRDTDGLRGTDPRIHILSGGLLDGEGPWHDDNGYFCYQCHTNTRVAGQGFCGYCHGRED